MCVLVEVQVLLRSIFVEKHWAHLPYEIVRGSFDWPHVPNIWADLRAARVAAEESKRRKQKELQENYEAERANERRKEQERADRLAKKIEQADQTLEKSPWGRALLEARKHPVLHIKLDHNDGYASDIKGTYHLQEPVSLNLEKPVFWYRT